MIIFLQEAYFVILISGLINVLNLRWHSADTWGSVSIIVTIALLLMAFILPLGTVCYIWPRYYKLQEPSIYNVLAPMYAMVNTGDRIEIA